MKIVVIHNEYQRPSGEESVVAEEIEALKELGHDVVPYIVHNAKLTSAWDTVRAAFANIFSVSQYLAIRKLIENEQPDLVHVHNFFPQISPAVFRACHKSAVPCLHTLHNYRLICPSTTLFHKGSIYYSGIKRQYLKVLRDGVYRQSSIATFFVLASILLHRWFGTWRLVDRFIVMSQFQRGIAAEFVGEKITLLPHFVRSPEGIDARLECSDDVHHLYVGRLDPEKGIHELLRAWPEQHRLNIVGDGTLLNEVKSAIGGRENIQLLGPKSRMQVFALMRDAKSVIVPSVCHEIFGLTVIESYAMGTPVLVNEIAPLKELVIDGETGLSVDIESPKSLKIALENIEKYDDIVRRRCFSEYNEKYSAAVGAAALESLLNDVIARDSTKT